MLLAAAVLLGGCVRVYHPLSGLHDPIVVDPRAPNFTDVSVTVRCLRQDDYLSGEENSALCENVGLLFETQGAAVTLVEMLGDEEVYDDRFGEDDDEGDEDAPTERTDLDIELRSHQVSQRKNGFTWILMLGTFTLLPAVQEHIFAVEVTVRDAEGFLLVEDTLVGRLVTRVGLGPVLVSRVGNLFRDPEDRLNTRTANRDVTRDLHRQLSQRLFDAKLQWQVLQEANGGLVAARPPAPDDEDANEALPGLEAPPDGPAAGGEDAEEGE